MIRAIFVTVLSLGIIGTAYWGYQEHREKNAVLLNAENNYQRAFHSLAYHMDVLHDKIGTTLAMNSHKSLSPSLAEVWRITSEAHNNVGQLPLTLLPFNKTNDFLTNVGNFSYRVAVRDLDKKPLSQQELKTLNALYQQSAEMQKEIRKVQHLVLKNNLRWMDVELALVTKNDKADNMILDGLKTVEKSVEGYNEMNSDPTIMTVKSQDDIEKNITGKPISKDEAAQIAQKIAQIGTDSKVTVTENGKGSKISFYSVTVTKNKQQANMDITKKGGHPIWFMESREINKQNISLYDASRRAAKYLKTFGYKNLELAESSQYDSVGVFTFVANEKGVRIYPDSIKIQIALDNGQILGFTAKEYLASNHERTIPKPTFTVENLRSKMNPNVKIAETRLAIITNNLNEEVLCYEYLGTIGKDSYRIYLNANSGEEEKVEKLDHPEPKYEISV